MASLNYEHDTTRISDSMRMSAIAVLGTHGFSVVTTKRETTYRQINQKKNHTNQLPPPPTTTTNVIIHPFTSSSSSQQTHFRYYTGAKQTSSIGVQP